MPGQWSGAQAVDMYENIIAPALKRYRGEKRRYVILEDNDPIGYKFNVGIDAKAKLKIHPLPFPTYSPDLNPCDFSLWEEVENRMAEQKAPRRETMEGFQERLCRTALGLPKRVVVKMCRAMKGRAQAIYEKDGGHIPRD